MAFNLATDLAAACLVLAFVATGVSILCAAFGAHRRYSTSARVSDVSAFVGLACFLVVLIALRVASASAIQRGILFP